MRLMKYVPTSEGFSVTTVIDKALRSNRTKSSESVSA